MLTFATPVFAAQAVPIPRQKPVHLAPIVETEVPSNSAQTSVKACQKLLGGLDVQWEASPPIGNGSGCGTPTPIIVSRVGGISIAPVATLNCPMAQALSQWVEKSLKPAAVKFGHGITQIDNASSYVCRLRNNQASGKMSEHAFANAIDVSGLVFDDGSRISVKQDWSGLLSIIGASPKAKFLKRIRGEACNYFTTVLGPGDPNHDDHFHVDLKQRSAGYRICQ